MNAVLPPPPGSGPRRLPDGVLLRFEDLGRFKPFHRFVDDGDALEVIGRYTLPLLAIAVGLVVVFASVAVAVVAGGSGSAGSAGSSLLALGVLPAMAAFVACVAPWMYRLSVSSVGVSVRHGLAHHTLSAETIEYLDLVLCEGAGWGWRRSWQLRATTVEGIDVLILDVPVASDDDFGVRSAKAATASAGRRVARRVGCSYRDLSPRPEPARDVDAVLRDRAEPEP